MLQDVLAAVAATPALRSAWIVTSDPEVEEVARNSGALVVPERPATGASPLNGALEQARAAIVASAAPPDALLVLPLDVPAVTPGTLSAFLRGIPSWGGPLVRICPSRRDGGTNGLLLRPPAVIPFRYGEGSASAHARAGIAAGATVTVRPLPVLEDDVDVPADIERLLRGASGPRTRAALRAMDMAQRIERRATPPRDGR